MMSAIFFLETFFIFSELNSIFNKCVWLKGYRKFAELDALLGDPIALPKGRNKQTARDAVPSLDINQDPISLW